MRYAGEVDGQRVTIGQQALVAVLVPAYPVCGASGRIRDVAAIDVRPAVIETVTPLTLRDSRGEVHEAFRYEEPVVRDGCIAMEGGTWCWPPFAQSCRKA